MEGERGLYIRLLAPDDAADLIQESPKHEREYLLELLDDITRQDARALLAYREDVAGGLMNPRFARLRPEASIDEAITYLRQQLSNVETIYYAYVLDEEQHLLGVVSLKGLVAADPNKTVKRFRAFCGHLGRRHRDHHLLHRRQTYPDRNTFMSGSRIVSPRAVINPSLPNSAGSRWQRSCMSHSRRLNYR